MTTPHNIPARATAGYGPPPPDDETGATAPGADRTHERPAPTAVRSGGQGEHRDSPRRVRAHLRAEQAARLRAQGATYAEIAATPDEDGQPLYSSHRRAQEAIRARIERGTTRIAAQLGGPDADDPTTPEGVDRLRRELITVLDAITDGELPATPDHLALLVEAATALGGIALAARS